MLSHLQKSKIFVENKKKNKETVAQKHKDHNTCFSFDMFFPHQQRLVK